MSRIRRTATWTGAAVALLLLLAACASKTNAGSGTPTNSAFGAGVVTVNATTVGQLGAALVTSDGFTLYALSADAGGKVTCKAAPCTTIWPPLLVPTGSTAVAGSGLNASMLGTVKTPSGATQVTYNKWPLYRFSHDTGANQTNGQDIMSFGGVWHPIAPSGQPIVGGPSTAPSSSSSPYGY